MAAMQVDAEGSRKEPGCRRFDCLRDAENENKFCESLATCVHIIWFLHCVSAVEEFNVQYCEHHAADNWLRQRPPRTSAAVRCSL